MLILINLEDQYVRLAIPCEIRALLPAHTLIDGTVVKDVIIVAIVIEPQPHFPLLGETNAFGELRVAGSAPSVIVHDVDQATGDTSLADEVDLFSILVDNAVRGPSDSVKGDLPAILDLTSSPRS